MDKLRELHTVLGKWDRPEDRLRALHRAAGSRDRLAQGLNGRSAKTIKKNSPASRNDPVRSYASRMFMISSALFTRPLPGKLISVGTDQPKREGDPRPVTGRE